MSSKIILSGCNLGIEKIADFLTKNQISANCDILRLFAKNHAFQNLMYLASISALRQVVINSRYMNAYSA